MRFNFAGPVVLLALGVAVATAREPEPPTPGRGVAPAAKAVDKAEPKPMREPGPAPGGDAEPRRVVAPVPLRVADVVGDAPPLPGPVAPLDSEPPPGESLFSLSTDALLWRIRRIPISAPLVSNRGFSGESVGPTDLNPGAFMGLGLGARLWLTPERRLGVEASGKLFEQRSHYFGILSGAEGLPQFDRPFISAVDGGAILVPVSVPGLLSGRLEATTATRFASGDGGFVFRLGETPSGGFRLDGSVGYRYQDLRESLTLRQASAAVNPSANPAAGALLLNFGDLGVFSGGSGYGIVDQFTTLNQFNGAQLGLRGTYTYRTLSMTIGVKTAYGENRRSVSASGGTNIFAAQSTTAADPNGSATTQVLPGGSPGVAANHGLFVGPSNRGLATSGIGSFLAEGNVEFGLTLTERLRLRLGYGAMYWTGVARPGQQLDPVIDPRQLRINALFDPNAPRSSRPAIPFAASNFFAFGFTLGAEWSF